MRIYTKSDCSNMDLQIVMVVILAFEKILKKSLSLSREEYVKFEIELLALRGK
jgi:hypothetical protein